MSIFLLSLLKENIGITPLHQFLIKYKRLLIEKMIRAFKIIALILLASTGLQAQLSRVIRSIDEVEILGAPALVSINNSSTQQGIEKENKIAHTLSISSIFHINEKFSFNGKFSIERKGIKNRMLVNYYNPSIDSTNCLCTTSEGIIKNNISLDYISFSPLLRIKLKSTSLFFEVGPYIGYLYKAQAKSEFLWDNNKETMDIKHFFKELDFGMSIAIGYSIQLSENVSINFQSLNNLGLLNINNENTTSSSATTQAYTFQIGMNYLFNKKNNL